MWSTKPIWQTGGQNFYILRLDQKLKRNWNLSELCKTDAIGKNIFYNLIDIC